MPKGPSASKREIATAFAVAQRQAKQTEQLLPVLQRVASDSEVSKSILTRPLRGRLKWLVLGR